MSSNESVVVIFLFKANLEQFRSQIPDIWSMVLKNFYQTKAENETKSHHIIAFIKTYYFCLKMPMFCQRILKLAKCRESWYYKAYFLKLDICAPIYQILGFLHNSNKNLRGVWFLPSSPTSK